MDLVEKIEVTVGETSAASKNIHEVGITLAQQMNMWEVLMDACVARCHVFPSVDIPTWSHVTRENGWIGRAHLERNADFYTEGLRSLPKQQSRL